MKEKKSDTFSFFRKSSSRYSFTQDKKKPELTPVQIQRLSWSSFPLSKLPNPDDVTKGSSLPARRTRSSENLKKQRSFHLSKSKSSSFFKSSSSAVKNIFSLGSSSPFVGSSSCSSASSSPKVRQSWSSNVMHILEKCETDDDYDDEECMEYKTIEGNLNSSSDSVAVNNKNRNFTPSCNTKYFSCNSRNYFPDSSLLEENEEEELMCTPKIICAHKKTADVSRKTRKQIIQELEYIRKLGILPEEVETKGSLTTPEQEKENLNPNYENYQFIKENINLNSLRGYKPTSLNQKEESISISNSEGCLQSNSEVKSEKILSDNRFLLSISDEFYDRDISSVHYHDLPHVSSVERENCDSSSDSTKESAKLNTSDVVDTKLTNISHFPLNETSNTHAQYVIPNRNENDITNNVSGIDKRHFTLPPSTKLESQKSFPRTWTLPNNTSPPIQSISSRVNGISTEVESGEDSDEMASDEGSSTFEERLEDDLEKLAESRTLRDHENETNTLSDEEEKVQLRRRSKPNLHIDIEKARSSKINSNERLLRRIGEECDSTRSSRSSKSSPRTPRSPVIDIDDIFTQKKKKIEESKIDNLTQVKDLTQRLRLETKSTCSHVEWLNGLKDKKDARQLAEVMSPAVLENSEGVFLLRDKGGKPTEEQRKKNVSKALVWIKDELIKMKEQDEQLARQLVHLQLEMQRLRLHKSCTQHEALLEEVTCEEEEQKAFMTSTDLIDLPNNLRECAFFSLRDFGVTRLNISNRRFTLR